MPNGPLFSDEPIGEINERCPAPRQSGGGGGKWDVKCVLDILCKKDKKVVDQLSKTTVDTAEEIWWDDEYYDGSKWTIKKFPGGGSADKASKQIMVLSDTTCEGAAETFYHEIWHQNQPASMKWPEPAEDDAYYNTELWTIENGMSGRPSLRTTDGAGKTVPDKTAIRKFVQEEYPSPPPAVGGIPQPRPIQADWKNKKTKVEDPATGATSWRPSKKDDFIPGPQQIKNPGSVPKSAWKCPPPPPPPPPPSKGCFIATAAYGSPMAAEVQFLRSLRDEVLRRSSWGAAFFDRYFELYYRFSPAVADEMERDPAFREAVRWSIVSPLVNYYRLLIERPGDWSNTADVETFLAALRRDMDAWLHYIPLPESFPGLATGAAAELSIALCLVLREPARRKAYLDRLRSNGSLPLRVEPNNKSSLEAVLARGGCSPSEIEAILDMEAGSDVG